ncbi:MAG TPA: hypothetical protein VEI74_14055 [Candidatus Methylomirabilis sp.]|nr:hypothetical protein [Candidatus Methylomirabilis sp.]
MAKPNYQFQKRQKELKKKKTQEKKRLRKREKGGNPLADHPELPAEQGETTDKDG